MSFDKSKQSKNNALYIFFISALILMVIIIVTRVDYNNTRIRATARTEEVLAASAQEQAQLFRAKLDGQYRILKTTAAAHSLIQDKQHYSETAFLNALLKDSGFYITGIADKNGQAKLSNSDTVNIRDRWYFKENMAGRNAIERVDKTLINRESFFVISVPIVTGGKPTGAVIGIYDESKFLALLIQQAYKERGYSFVCSSAGALVVGTRHANSGWVQLNRTPAMNDNFINKISENPGNSADVLQIKNDFSLQRSGTLRYDLNTGVGRIAFYYPIGINGWYMLSVVTTDVIEESVKMEMRDARLLYFVIILASLILIIIVLILERKNIKQISEDRKRLKASEEEYRIAAAHSGKAVLRYDAVNKKLTTSKRLEKLFGLAPVYENFPDSFLYTESVAEESRPKLQKFYEAIKAGEPNGKIDAVALKFPVNSDYRWYTHDFTTIYDDAGVPVSTIITFSDVTEQVEKERSYRKWREYIDTIGSSKIAFVSHNITKDTAMEDDWNDKSLELFSDLREKAFNARTREFAEQNVYEEDRDTYNAFVNRERLLAEFHKGILSSSLEFRVTESDKKLKWAKISIQLVQESESKDVIASMFFQDINEQKNKELTIIAQAEQDSLTKVLNREAFLGRTEELLKHSKEGTKHAIMMMDIDKFKLINDTLGHVAGDNVLTDLTQKLKTTMRGNDLLGRLGGDEFIVCLIDIPDDSVTEKRAKQMVELLRRDLDNGIKVSVSIGISVFPRDGSTIAELYEKADIALYRTKAAGKDSYTFYENGMSHCILN